MKNHPLGNSRIVNGQKSRALNRWLQKELSVIGKGLSNSLNDVMEACEKGDATRASRLISQLKILRKRENVSQDTCLRILAQLEGTREDLRWTGRAHKILSLMEKSSIEIEKIAENVSEIDKTKEFPFVRDLPEMGRLACGMLDQSTHTALRPKAEDARKIIENDSFLDRSRDAFKEKAEAFRSQHPEATQSLIPYLHIAKHLEKIGDHASHIAEEVIYFLNGKDH